MMIMQFLPVVLALMLAGDASPRPSEEPVSVKSTGCMPRESVNAMMASYKLVPLVIGVDSDGATMTVFAAPDGGDHTVVFSYRERSCIVAWGQHWKRFDIGDPKPEGDL